MFHIVSQKHLGNMDMGYILDLELIEKKTHFKHLNESHELLISFLYLTVI